MSARFRRAAHLEAVGRTRVGAFRVKSADAVTLTKFNAWANRKVLAKAGRLPPNLLHGKARLSHPSPIATLVHILDTQWYWREGAQHGLLPVAAMTPSDFPTVHALRRRWDEEDRLLLRFIASCSERQLMAPVSYSWPRARPRRQVLWHLLAHIINHSTQHRSELASYLTERNLSPGNLDFLRFLRSARARQ